MLLPRDPGNHTSTFAFPSTFPIRRHPWTGTGTGTGTGRNGEIVNPISREEA